MRAHGSSARPAPRPYVAAHWRFGQLYKNPDDPALFVPTRDGSRWTLNFGRPVAAALLGLILVIGIVGPTVILSRRCGRNCKLLTAIALHDRYI